MNKFDNRKSRMFIVEIEILEEVWGWEIGDILRVPILSNSYNKANYTFYNKHCGSEYPDYIINSIEDCKDYAFFTPNFKSKNLI
jgi:hypothetical protein